MSKKLIIVLILGLSLSLPCLAQSDIDRKFEEEFLDEFDRPERPYLLYKATLGITLEGYLPITRESRSEYNFGEGIGANLEFHLLYPISIGLNYRVSRVSRDNSYFPDLNLRTLGVTLRLFIPSRGDNFPYMRLGLGAGDAKSSNPDVIFLSSRSFTSGEIGAGYMMRLGSSSWLRFETVYTSNFSPDVLVYAPVYDDGGFFDYYVPVSYDLKGLTFRFEAGIVSW